ncbi:MAG: DUF3786 domain-containing protein [Oscillospiraceae bacterium]|nr:DUF3786 domain-containing protein [Oscillospiraceae bacterium]
METPYRADNLTQVPLEHYLGLLCRADASEVSRRLGLPWDGRGFTLTVLGEEKHISFPAFDDEGWTDRWRILFARYLLEGKKVSAPAGFVTYSQMPWGDVYNEKFRQRCILRLAGTYGFRPEAYRAVCAAMGAKSVPGSGEGFEFEFLPDLFVRFILWEGDEEFPPSSQILFSDNFPQTFAAEDRVVVCEYILGEMKRAGIQ